MEQISVGKWASLHMFPFWAARAQKQGGTVSQDILRALILVSSNILIVRREPVLLGEMVEPGGGAGS